MATACGYKYLLSVPGHGYSNRLKALLRVQNHPMVTPEIRRELFSARNRGDPFVALAGVDADMAEA